MWRMLLEAFRMGNTAKICGPCHNKCTSGRDVVHNEPNGIISTSAYELDAMRRMVAVPSTFAAKQRSPWKFVK